MAKYKTDTEKTGIELKEKVEHLLEEVRIVLPGTQVLLGFQFTAIFSNGFDKLNDQLQQIHLASLGCILFAIIFIMIPPSYHRIADEGDDTERFHTVSSMVIIASLFMLALGIAIDMYVVVSHVMKDNTLALISSAVTLVGAYLAWFAFPIISKKKN